MINAPGTTEKLNSVAGVLLDTMNRFNSNQIIEPAMKFLVHVIERLNLKTLVENVHFKNILNGYFTQNDTNIAMLAIKLITVLLNVLAKYSIEQAWPILNIIMNNEGSDPIHTMAKCFELIVIVNK